MRRRPPSTLPVFPTCSSSVVVVVVVVHHRWCVCACACVRVCRYTGPLAGDAESTTALLHFVNCRAGGDSLHVTATGAPTVLGDTVAAVERDVYRPPPPPQMASALASASASASLVCPVVSAAELAADPGRFLVRNYRYAPPPPRCESTVVLLMSASDDALFQYQTTECCWSRWFLLRPCHAHSRYRLLFVTFVSVITRGIAHTGAAKDSIVASHHAAYCAAFTRRLTAHSVCATWLPLGPLRRPRPKIEFVAKNKPVLIKGGALGWPAIGKWSALALDVVGEGEGNAGHRVFPPSTRAIARWRAATDDVGKLLRCGFAAAARSDADFFRRGAVGSAEVHTKIAPGM